MKTAQRAFLVKVAGIDGYWMTKSGGDVSSDVAKVYDGGSDTPELVSAPSEADNVTVTRGFDPYAHNDLIKRLRRQVGRWQTTVSVTPTDADFIAIGAPTTYPLALLVGLTEPEPDASSGDAAMWGLEFAVGQYS